MKQDILKELMQKYINGECTPEEITAIHDWYASFENEQSPIDSLNDDQQQFLKNRLLNRIRTNITLHDIESKQIPARKRLTNTLIYSLSGIAAMVILVIGILFFSADNSGKPVVSNNMVVVNMTQSIQKIELEDGSIVWLNPKSKIEYPEKFKGSKRDIKMTGEAFFEVTPDKKRPFIVLSNKVITRVWGTSFRIRAIEESPVEVSVVTGKVSVMLEELDDSEVMLLPDQKATYLKGNNSLKKEAEKKTSAIRIWKKATMSFDNVPIKEVIHALNNKFGVNIHSSDEKLLNYVLKADFTDQNLPSILEMLEKSLEVQYEIKDKEIILNTK
ncbi:MAG TPA: FecR family protein [Sphingobacteriaceae bacterium]